VATAQVAITHQGPSLPSLTKDHLCHHSPRTIFAIRCRSKGVTTCSIEVLPGIYGTQVHGSFYPSCRDSSAFQGVDRVVGNTTQLGKNWELNVAFCDNIWAQGKQAGGKQNRRMTSFADMAGVLSQMPAVVVEGLKKFDKLNERAELSRALEAMAARGSDCGTEFDAVMQVIFAQNLNIEAHVNSYELQCGKHGTPPASWKTGSLVEVRSASAQDTSTFDCMVDGIIVAHVKKNDMGRITSDDEMKRANVERRNCAKRLLREWRFMRLVAESGGASGVRRVLEAALVGSYGRTEITVRPRLDTADGDDAALVICPVPPHERYARLCAMSVDRIQGCPVPLPGTRLASLFARVVFLLEPQAGDSRTINGRRGRSWLVGNDVRCSCTYVHPVLYVGVAGAPKLLRLVDGGNIVQWADMPELEGVKRRVLTFLHELDQGMREDLFRVWCWDDRLLGEGGEEEADDGQEAEGSKKKKMRPGSEKQRRVEKERLVKSEDPAVGTHPPATLRDVIEQLSVTAGESSVVTVLLEMADAEEGAARDAKLQDTIAMLGTTLLGGRDGVSACKDLWLMQRAGLVPSYTSERLIAASHLGVHLGVHLGMVEDWLMERILLDPL
jgi:hypothetical protein